MKHMEKGSSEYISDFIKCLHRATELMERKYITGVKNESDVVSFKNLRRDKAMDEQQSVMERAITLEQLRVLNKIELVEIKNTENCDEAGGG